MEYMQKPTATLGLGLKSRKGKKIYEIVTVEVKWQQKNFNIFLSYESVAFLESDEVKLDPNLHSYWLNLFLGDGQQYLFEQFPQQYWAFIGHFFACTK